MKIIIIDSLDKSLIMLLIPLILHLIIFIIHDVALGSMHEIAKNLIIEYKILPDGQDSFKFGVKINVPF